MDADIQITITRDTVQEYGIVIIIIQYKHNTDVLC